MEFQARVLQCLPEITGTSKAGNPWKKKEWIVETFGQFPKKVKVQCFGDRSDSIILEPGKDYTLSVDLESREFNGRWYTDVSVFRVSEITGGQQSFGGQPQGGYNSGFGQPSGSVGESVPFGGSNFGGNHPTFTPSEDESGEDLPF